MRARNPKLGLTKYCSLCAQSLTLRVCAFWKHETDMIGFDRVCTSVISHLFMDRGRPSNIAANLTHKDRPLSQYYMSLDCIVSPLKLEPASQELLLHCKVAGLAAPLWRVGRRNAKNAHLCTSIILHMCAISHLTLPFIPSLLSLPD